MGIKGKWTHGKANASFFSRGFGISCIDISVLVFSVVVVVVIAVVVVVVVVAVDDNVVVVVVVVGFHSSYSGMTAELGVDGVLRQHCTRMKAHTN